MTSVHLGRDFQPLVNCHHCHRAVSPSKAHRVEHTPPVVIDVGDGPKFVWLCDACYQTGRQVLIRYWKEAAD